MKNTYSAKSAGALLRPKNRAVRNYQQKERCIVWLPESKTFLQGVTAHSIFTTENHGHATVFEGDRATNMAEMVMTFHRLKPVLRSHYGRVQ